MIIEQDDFFFNYSDKIHGETIQFVNCHSLTIESCVLEHCIVSLEHCHNVLIKDSVFSETSVYLYACKMVAMECCRIEGKWIQVHNSYKAWVENNLLLNSNVYLCASKKSRRLLVNVSHNIFCTGHVHEKGYKSEKTPQITIEDNLFLFSISSPAIMFDTVAPLKLYVSGNCKGFEQDPLETEADFRLFDETHHQNRLKYRLSSYNQQATRHSEFSDVCFWAQQSEGDFPLSQLLN